MAEVNIGALRAVSARLEKLGIKYAFTGGSVINLLLDKPDLSPARPTDDVDVIIELLSELRYSDLEEKLRSIGFAHDMSEGAPKCRWTLGSLRVDIMPTHGEGIGLNTKWFSEALDTSNYVSYSHTRLPIVSPIGLLVTKYLTFTERGEGDYYGSHDLEDFITVIDGRQDIIQEVDAARIELRNYLIEGIRNLLAKEEFVEALVGFLPPDSASQKRLPLLRSKLQKIAELKK